VMELAAGHEPVRYDDIRITKKPRGKPPQQRGTGHPPSLNRPAAARPWRTAEMQLQFPLRLSGYPGTAFPVLAGHPAIIKGAQRRTVSPRALAIYGLDSTVHATSAIRTDDFGN
jgi:hypothetical protein